MQEQVKQVLRELIEKYRVGILEDPDRLSQFLEDRCPSDRADNFQLTFALRCLVKNGWTPYKKVTDERYAMYVRKLRENLAFSAADADDVMRTLTEITSLKNENAQEEDGRVVAHPGNLRRISGGIATEPRTMWLRKKSLYNGIVLLAALAAIVVLFWQIGTQRSPVGNEFRIAFFTPMSGPFAESSHDQLRAAQLAVEHINRQGGLRGYKLKIIGYDIPMLPAAASEKVRSVMQDRSLLVMMTGVGGKIVESLSRTADDIEVPLVITAPEALPSSTVGEDGKPYLYSFRISNDSNETAKMMSYFASQGLLKRDVGIFYDSSSPYSAAVHDRLLKWIKVFGGNVTADVSYSSAASRTSDHTVALKAIRSSGAAVMMIPGRQRDTAQIMMQIKAVGYSGSVIGTGYTETLSKEAGNAMSGSWWINEITPLDPQVRSVLKDYRSLYNEVCGDDEVLPAMLAYDGVRLIAGVLYTTSGYRGEAIRHALLSTRNFPMTHATLTIDPRTHGPYNKAVALINCAEAYGIFQKRIIAGKTD